MSTRMIMTLVAAAALTAGAALGGCGSTATAPPAGSASSPQVAQAHNQADISFAQGMIPHHAQAIAMSEMAAQRAASPEVKELAVRIQAAQQPEIDQMSGFLRAWNAPVPSTTMPMGQMGEMGQMDHGAGGAMPGMMSGDQMQQLGQASGAAFDRMFLQMMITHHQGAVTMAETELRDGQNPEARQLAQRIIDDQQREITEMQALLDG
ncbi:MAG TPA: DUF305 domain-containing protein [Pseudonocardiaceae bacterium]|nr:DUF305 domain-containing protein [Pseudonocardiaceae bacterium]